jgi:hypothetical protein
LARQWRQTQKPQAVIDRLEYYYAHENSNVHRAAHPLVARSTDAFEAAREKARRFLNASSTKEIVFVRGATEAVSLVAQSWGRRNVSSGDEIVVTWLEHHADIVPWQQLCQATGARRRVAPPRRSLQLREFAQADRARPSHRRHSAYSGADRNHGGGVGDGARAALRNRAAVARSSRIARPIAGEDRGREISLHERCLSGERGGAARRRGLQPDRWKGISATRAVAFSNRRRTISP